MVRARTILAWTLVATALHGVIALAASTNRRAFGAEGPERVGADVRLYHRYASRTLGGEIPYRDFLVEYPPLALPLFVLPRLVAADFATYRVAFAAEMLLCDALAVFLVARRVARDEGIGRLPGRLAWYTLAFAALCPLAVHRYDLAPMALAFAAALAWSSGRASAGGALTAVATLMKVYPGALIAPALAWEAGRAGCGRFRWRGMVAFAGAMAVGAAAWLAIGGDRVRESLGYHSGRGLEVGSTYAGASMALGRALHVPLRTDFNHASTELVAPWSPALARLAMPLQAAALALVAWRSRRSGGADPLRYAAAAVLAFVVFGKVLSPQYLLWLLPFMAALPARGAWRVRGVFLLTCVLTTMIYPWAINSVLAFKFWAVNLLNCRNVLLLGLWAGLTFGPAPRAGIVPAGRPSEIRAGGRPLRIEATGRA